MISKYYRLVLVAAAVSSLVASAYAANQKDPNSDLGKSRPNRTEGDVRYPVPGHETMQDYNAAVAKERAERARETRERTAREKKNK